MIAASERPAEPDRIAQRYLVEDILGEGAMGAIYRVVDSQSGGHVALKQLKLPEDTTREVRVALFEREYQTLQAIAHPRIIRVFDYGLTDDGPYYTMELLDGEDMRSQAPLSMERACALLRDVASSLAIIHSRGLVYRDLSQRNVRCTSDGRAKLLDFGALTPMGTPRQLVGTPGFIPPEAVYGQPLDQRADLYALGVLAYWLLTGKRPYPARQLSALRDAWRSRPVPPSALMRDIPEALDALIMSLLSLNPTGRPPDAGEVIDKLTAIGKLPKEQDLGVMRAYLTTPEMVGRDDQLMRLRKALVRATRKRGSAFVVRAEPGAGTSRLIDAAVLEAKLVGALTARAETGDREAAPFAVLEAVVQQWAGALPDAAGAALRARFAQTRAPCEPGAAQPTVGSDRIHERLADAVLSAAPERTLVLAIDDGHCVDGASLAVFALLAQAAEHHRLLLVAGVPKGTDASASIPLRMLLEGAKPIGLPAWSPDQTESLLRSVFGDVPNLPLLANRIHRVALGNPRDTMQLAQHLVDAAVVRHQDGAWVLPGKLDEVALPDNMTEAQQQMVVALAPADRTLAATLALVSDLPALSVVDLARLGPDALSRCDGLIQRRILVPQAAGFAFRHRGVAEALLDGLHAAERQRAHVALAAVFEGRSRDMLTRAYHLHCAGDSAACLAVVRPWLAEARRQRFHPQHVVVLEAIVAEADRYPISRLERYQLQALLVQHAAIAEPECGRHGEDSFAQLRHDTGLAYWDEFDDADPTARIGRCLQKAQAVFDAAPEAERCFAPIDAIRELALLVRSLTSVYARMLASEQLIALSGWLHPFRTLSPLVDVLYQLTAVSTDRAVREKRVAHRYLEFAERFAQPMQGADDAARKSVGAICTYCAAMDEAKQGKPSALARVEPLGQLDDFAALMWHVRMLSHIYSGRTAEAAACRQRMELLVIQQNQPNTLLAMSVLYEAWGYELCEDLTGLKGALRRVEHEARRFSGWQPWAVMYRGDTNRLRGDLEAALRDYEEALRMTTPGRHQVWPHAAERRIVALRELGRAGEAVQLGRQVVAYAEEEDLEPVNLLRAYVALSLSEARAGDPSRARALIERALTCIEREGIGGVPRGIVYEGQARIALWSGDAEGFAQASERCAEDLLAGHNAALTAKYERLLREARDAGLIDDTPAERLHTPSTSTGLHPELQRLRSVSDPAERAEILLTCLIDGYQAAAGCLFGVTAAGPQWLGGRGPLADRDEMTRLVADYLAAELTDTEFVTATQADERAAVGSGSVWTVQGQGGYQPVLLLGESGQEERITAVALVRVEAEAPCHVDATLLRAVGQAVLDGGLVTGLPVAH